jgi:hypothetical protein
MVLQVLEIAGCEKSLFPIITVRNDGLGTSVDVFMIGIHRAWDSVRGQSAAGITLGKKTEMAVFTIPCRFLARQ